MKCLTFELQPDIDASLDEKPLIDLVRSMGRFPEIDTYIRKEKDFINLNFFSEDLPLLWGELKSALEGDQEINNWVNRVAIIACEGEEGWDDFLLLRHYDESEKTVEL